MLLPAKLFETDSSSAQIMPQPATRRARVFQICISGMLAGTFLTGNGCSSSQPDPKPTEFKPPSASLELTPKPPALDLPQAIVTASDRIQSVPRFSDVATASGLNFTYDNGARGQILMVEAIGGGCGWLDYDNDGRMDVYFPQGGNAAPLTSAFVIDVTPASSRIFRKSGVPL